MKMNYFDSLSFDKGIITVLGTSVETDFVNSLKEFLSLSGSVTVTDQRDMEKTTDYLVIVPDKCEDHRFIMHEEEEAAKFRESDYIIGIVWADILTMKIADAIVGAEKFADYTDRNIQDIVQPRMLGKVIQEHEKYDYLYIDGVSDDGKRYNARELARVHKSGTSVRMINTDNSYVETLIRGKCTIK